MGNTLIVDFHGPIAFRFATDSAWAYIPDCKDHTGNLLTDTNDVPLDKNTTYTLSGPTAAKNTQKGGAPFVSVDWSVVTKVKKDPPKDTDCYCIFNMPLPDYILGLRPEPVSITDGNNVPVVNGDYARGLRFYYSDCLSLPAIVDSAKTPLPFIATCFQPSPSTDVNYRIEIRFYDYEYDQTAAEYADAKQCSETMRALFPPLDQWNVTFGGTSGSSGTSGSNGASRSGRASGSGGASPSPAPLVMLSPGPHGSDCGANGIIFNDGGL